MTQNKINNRISLQPRTQHKSILTSPTDESIATRLPLLEIAGSKEIPLAILPAASADT
ncbi:MULTISPECIES: hypothetical protein [Oscillatoriales]|uniref:hypothetical protein n=1 Tax=Oscillatoriales TaxID=1150 RepID=UPI00167F554C|nr:hypothetical protein [Oscillatoria nigro-viridis]